MRLGLFVSFGIGGADKSAEQLAKKLFHLKPNWDIKIFYNSLSFPKIVAGFHEENQILLSRFQNYLSFCNPIEIHHVSEFNQYNLDILQVFRSGEDLWLLPDFEKTKFNFKIVEKNFHGSLLTKADMRIFPSKSIFREGGTVIGNPIDLPITSLSLREDLGLKNKFIFGRIGRPEHFSTTILDAYAKIRNENTVLLWVAPNSSILNYIKKGNFNDIIPIDQTVNDLLLSKIYNTFDVFCHGNPIGETFGNTIVEAALHKKPIVSLYGTPSWPQAQRELLKPFEKQIIFSQNDVKGYANIMSKYMENSVFRNNVSNTLFNNLKKFESSKITEEYIKVYESIINC